MENKEILCLSGGIDSFVAWHYLNKPQSIYFHTGLPHCEKELKIVHEMTNGSVLYDTSLNFSKEKDVYIPHRNLLFASRASRYAEKVWIVGVKDDMVEDKTENAFNLMSLCLSTIGKEPVTVDSPFWDMTKTEVIRWYMDNIENDSGAAERVLNTQSISCYSGGDKPCYACESCFRKACAMQNAGLHCYFNNDDMVIKYMAKAKFGAYILQRNAEILKFGKEYFSL